MAAVQPDSVPANMEKEATSTTETVTEVATPQMVVPEEHTAENISPSIVDQAVEMTETTPKNEKSGEGEAEAVAVAVVNSELGAVTEETNTVNQTENASDAPTESQEPELPKEPTIISVEVISSAVVNPTPQVEGVTEMECETAPNVEAATTESTTSGLGLLAAYSSDGDTDTETVHKVGDSDSEHDDDVIEVPVQESSISTGPRQVVAVSSGSDSSSNSDSDSEGEYLTVLRKKIDKRINTEEVDEDEDEDDEDGTRPRRRQPPKVRGEMMLDELPPIDQLEITVPEDECIELGKVQSIVDQLVLVSVLPNSMLFDLDTVLFLEKGRKVLGQVFDVLGQVADPLYCVRFNSNQQIKDRGINIGDTVYCAPQTEHTQFVILSKLMQVRGSDASWEHDVEPPARFIDYSDDEEEREARWELRKKRQRERTNSTDSVETVATTNTESTEVSAVAPPRQRGRRGQRDKRRSQNYQNGNQQQQQMQQQPQQSPARDSQYNYHPSYNPGSWHSNYYHNYHPPAANFNMMPGMAFPMPQQGYGYMPPPHPYSMPPPMPMGMPPPPPHMYQQPPPFNPHQQPPNGGR